MAIPLNLTFRDVDSSPAVEARVREWVDKLEAVYDRVLRCEVAIERPHRRHRQGNQFHVRIAMSVPGNQLVVSRDPGPDERHQDVYVAIRDSFHAARRQLEDHVRLLRGAVKAHEGPPHARVAFLDLERAFGFLEDPGGRRIYFHRNSVIGDMDQLAVGDEVRFAEEAGADGPQASSVEVVGRHGHHELPDREGS